MVPTAAGALRKHGPVDGSSGLLRELGAGFLAALPALTNCFAYGALIFSGPLRPFLAEGIAASLTTCAVSALVIALTSRFRTAIAGPVATVSAVLALLAASLGPAMEGMPANQRLALAYAALFTATTTTAAALLLVGFVRAGRLVRFVPYPVIAGFMGATGWLVVAGAIKMATDVPIELRLLPDFAHRREGLLLALLLGCTAGLWFATKKIKHPLTLPVALVLASLVTDLTLPILHISGKDAAAAGILFTVGNTAWPGIPALNGTYFQADWTALVPAIGPLGAVILITVLQALFLASGLEISTRTEVDLDHEVRSAGWANLASAALGGFVSQIALSATTVNRTAGGTSRLTGIVVSLIALVCLFGADSALEFIPRFVLGGVLLLQGLLLLQEWAIMTYRTLPRMEWILVIAIIAITAWLGFVPAELGGLLAACVLFAISVTRIDIVRAVYGLNARTSSVVRSEEETRMLAEHGSRVQVMELKGFIFFGSAFRLREKVKAVVAESRCLMLIFDFSRVIGIDSSAAATVVGLSRSLHDTGIGQLIVGLSPTAIEAFRQSDGLGKNVAILTDMDEALERGEQLVLAPWASDPAVKPPFSDWLSAILGNPEDAAILQGHLASARYKAGDLLCRQGDLTDDLYFIEAGRLSAIVESDVAAPARLRVFGTNTVVGEIAFLLNVPRTASLRVDEDAIVWSLTREAFDQLLTTHPSLILELQRDVLRIQVERLAFATRRIAALQL
jgi:SulP family sulfate permease